MVTITKEELIDVLINELKHEETTGQTLMLIQNQYFAKFLTVDSLAFTNGNMFRITGISGNLVV